MEDVNELILNRLEVEGAIADKIAVVYRLQSNNYADTTRTAIKPDQFGNYKIMKYNNYLLITAKGFFKIENGKLEKVHPFS